MKKFKSILFFCLLSISPVFSQMVHENDRFTPSSPTVYELGKYGIIPVGYYTGIPDISIPLGEIECGRLKLPITLRYHAGGIKVEQIASWVGLGWSLDAGGIISENITGRCDLIRTENNPKIFNFEDIESGQLPTYSDLISAPDFDFQPDIFSYNFNGYSGQFVLDDSLVPHEIRNNQELKILISRTLNPIHILITIIDGNGIRYEFDDMETTTRYIFDAGYSTINGQIYYNENEWRDKYKSQPILPTAWFLSRIISPNYSDTIKFIYENEVQKYTTKLDGFLYYSSFDKEWRSRNELLSSSETAPHGTNGFVFSKMENNTKRLKCIEGNNGVKIDFTADHTREDLTGSKRLDQIKMYYRNSLVKQWDLAYTYFQSSITHSSNATLNKRLRLSSITENQLKTWNFHYYGDDSGDHQMPYRTAYCGSDYWGFSNSAVSTADANNPAKLFSQLNGKILSFQRGHINNGSILVDQIKQDTVYYLAGSTKEPNIHYMKTYTLDSISYPTGGASKFIYEAHDYRRVGMNLINIDKTAGGLRIKEVISYSAPGKVATKKSYQYSSNDLGNVSSGTIINDIQESVMKRSLTGLTSTAMNYNAIWENLLELNSSSYTSLYSYGGEYIGYSRIIESNDTGASTEYTFYSIADFPNEYLSYYMYLFYYTNYLPFYSESHLLEYPMDPFLFGYWGASYGRGLLRSKSIFNANHQLLAFEENSYIFEDKARIYGMEIHRGSLLGENFEVNCYFHQTGQVLLSSKLIEKYDQNGLNPVRITEQYTYTDKNLVKTISGYHGLSNDQIYKTEYKYPVNYDYAPYKDMVSKNILTPVIEQTEYRSNVFTQKKITDYKNWGNNIFSPEFIKWQTKNQTNLETRITYHKYDSHGNPVHITQDGAKQVIYLWGYNSQYPIAEIVNATYSEVQTAVSNLFSTSIDALATQSIPNETKLTNGSLQDALPQALVTTYTYKPLVGVWKMQNPRSVVSEYVYDNFGRLQQIKVGGKVEKEYEYHYKN